MPIFRGVLQIFYLECHGEACLKIVFVVFDVAFMKSDKLKSLHRESKKLNHNRT